jgi:hypothetical protein
MSFFILIIRKVKNIKLLESLMKKSVSVKDNGDNKDTISLKELQLSEDMLQYQKKISSLENNFKLLSNLVSKGEMSEKSIKEALKPTNNSNANLFTKNKDLTKINNDKTTEINSNLDKKLNINDKQKNTKNPIVKNLIDEVKYLTVKLEEIESVFKIADTKLKSSGGGGNISDVIESDVIVGDNQTGNEGNKIEEKVEEIKENEPPIIEGDGINIII